MKLRWFIPAPVNVRRFHLRRAGRAVRSGMVFALCGTAMSAPAQVSPPIRINPHAHAVVGQSCDDYLERVRTLLPGRIRTAVDVYEAFKGGKPPYAGKPPYVHTHFRKGTRVIIAGQEAGVVCVGSYDDFPRNGWVPRSDIKVLKRNSKPPPNSFNGLWVNQNGDWFLVAGAIVDGRACWAQCKHLGRLGHLGLPDGPSGLLYPFHVVNALGVGLNWTRLFELPTLYYAPQGRTSRIPHRSATQRTTHLSPHLADTCRFYATLLLGAQRMIVSDEHGSCGGLNVRWVGMYYKILSYPPYDLMKAYFKRLGKPFAPLPEKMKTQ